MPRVLVDASLLRRSAPFRGRNKRVTARRSPDSRIPALHVLALLAGVVCVALLYYVHENWTISLQSPVSIHLHWPLVVSKRDRSVTAYEARTDQGQPLTAYQQYACQKFGDACRVALAIQRAENPGGKCEIYHYNSDGTLDWGYFQINTVHLKRPGVNLRDLLDCKANIDFAFFLYKEKGSFGPWSTYKNGLYRQYLR